MPLTTKCKVKVTLGITLGLGIPFLLSAMLSDLHDQSQVAPRLLPLYSGGNPLGYGLWRPCQGYGAPHWGGALSNVHPPYL